ncbi:MAG: hypothetical protein HYX82_00080 [Chloroflexi bacterium]|nr:hypothetical protein [Chloroflexota bacterium]
MSQLEDVLKATVKELNSRVEKLAKVRTWIDGYRGKIIGLRTPHKAYHIVFTMEKVDLREGEYPSVDVGYIGDEDVLVKILKGETSGREEIRKGSLKTWQNLHETFKFEDILRS